MQSAQRLAMLAGVAVVAQASLADNTATVDLSGILIEQGADITRSSDPDSIDAATGYVARLDPQSVIQVGGLLSLLVGGAPQTIEDLLLDLVALVGEDPVDAESLLTVELPNPDGALPTDEITLFLGETLEIDGFGSFELGVDFTAQIDANGFVSGGVSNVRLGDEVTQLGTIEIITGSIIVEIFEPTPTDNEWQFNSSSRAGELTRTDGTGMAEIRFLDDPDFGSPRGSNDPGLTEAQSSFGTTTSFGLPDINGLEASVYCTSAPRDDDGVGSGQGIGLAFWANSRDNQVDGEIGRWTFILDVYVPQAAIDSAKANSSEYVCPIINTNDNNANNADFWLKIDESDNLQLGGNWRGEPEFFSSPQLVPDAWLRIAIVSDDDATQTARYFVNGTFIGEGDDSDWIYTRLDPAEPKYATGEAIDPADWAAWGMFPRPWPRSGDGAETQATICLFADDNGEGESIYLANLYFTDRNMTDAEIADLGGPDATGIVYNTPVVQPCIPDLDPPGGDGALGFFDLVAYLTLFAAMDPAADLDPPGGDGSFGFFDLVAYLTLFAAGCP